jgi:hypothetical protein
MGTWQFARQLFDEHFWSLRESGYGLERLENVRVYRELHERDLRRHFPPEAFFALDELRTEQQRSGQERIAASAGGEPLRDFTVIRSDDGALVGMFSGEQRSPSMYRMGHSHIHPSFRRRGIYRQILAGTIRYTAALGFDTITSEHAPCNNAILIAKLRAGFCLYGMDMDPMAGPSVTLRYFHNPEHRAAYELRCGMATLTPGLAAHGTGAWSLLREQLLAATPEGG